MFIGIFPISQTLTTNDEDTSGIVWEKTSKGNIAAGNGIG
jgi:hypothetical protein